MYSVQHIIWLVISMILIGAGMFLIRKYNPDEKTVFTAACVVCVLSECAKVFSTIRMLPLADGSTYVPLLERQEVPLHLCSIHIFFIFYIRLFSAEGSRKTTVLGFMFPTMVIGALFALFIPSIFATVPASKAFTHPQIYQTFVYHSMLVVLGVYIYRSRFTEWRTRHYFSTLSILGVLTLGSIYVNSVLAYSVFDEAHVISSVEKITNFFFVARIPVGIALYEKWQWLLYIAIISCLAVLLIGIWYIPAFRRDLRDRRASR